MKISYKKFQKTSQTVWNKCLSKWVVIGIQLPIMQRNFSCHLLQLSISTKSLWYVCIYSSGYIYFITGYCCQYHEWNFIWHTIHSNSMKPSVRNRLFLLELLACEVPKTPKCPNALGVRLLLRTSHKWLRAQRYRAGTQLTLPSYCLTLIMFEGAMHTITNPTHHYLMEEGYLSIVTFIG